MNLNSGQILDEATIGARIRNRRQQLGLTQQALIAGRYSKTYLSQVERGLMKPSREFLQHIANRLSISLEELLAEKDPTPFEGYELKLSRKISKEGQELDLMNAHVALQSGQPEKSLKFLDKVEPDSLPSDLQAIYYATLGEAKLEVREFDHALPELERALKMFEADPKVTALQIERTRNCIGLVYYRQNKNFVAMEYHRLCLRAISEGRVDDQRFKLKILYNLANDYYGTKDYKQALEVYREGAKLAEEHEDNRDLAGIYWGIGAVYHSIEDQPDENESKENLSLAKLYMHKAAALYESIDELRLASIAKSNLAAILIERGEIEEAGSLLRSALELATQVKEDRAVALAHLNLAGFYQKKGQLAQAEQNALISIAIFRESKEFIGVNQALVQLAGIKVAQGSHEEGIKFFEEAIAVLDSEAVEQISKTYFAYAAVLESIGKLSEAVQQYRKAYQYQKN